MKKQRREGDLVLIIEKNKPISYAIIKSIEADVKKDWFVVSFILLSIPNQEFTWILRREYIDGEDFTIGEIPLRIDDVSFNFNNRSLTTEENNSNCVIRVDFEKKCRIYNNSTNDSNPILA